MKLPRFHVAESLMGVAIVAVGVRIVVADIAGLQNRISITRYHPWVIGLVPMACGLMLVFVHTVSGLFRGGECRPCFVGFVFFGVLAMFIYGLVLAAAYAYTSDPLWLLSDLTWKVFGTNWPYYDYRHIGIYIVYFSSFPRSRWRVPADGSARR